MLIFIYLLLFDLWFDYHYLSNRMMPSSDNLYKNSVVFTIMCIRHSCRFNTSFPHFTSACLAFRYCILGGMFMRNPCEHVGVNCSLCDLRWRSEASVVLHACLILTVNKLNWSDKWCFLSPRSQLLLDIKYNEFKPAVYEWSYLFCSFPIS